MRSASSIAVVLMALMTVAAMPAGAADDPPIIARKLPPPGTALAEADRAKLHAGLNALNARLAKAGNAPLLADIAVFAKAVDLALRFSEFYDQSKDVAKAEWALQQANQRLDQLAAAPWTRQSGSVVRGYVSSIDGSVQPYGLVIPEKLDQSRPAPLYVWLHGRSETETDLHFLFSRARGAGEIHPDDVIVLHAFGRCCVGFKHAGEVDVLEATAQVQARYRIDPERIVLMGFSMGGAGAKHIGAHYTDHFAAIHTGAGFAETARYLGLKPEEFPPLYEQTLWGLYDVPDYVRNLFNVPFIAYSGEQDKQIQAARVLEEAFTANGQTLTHLIGPGVGHRYQPDTLKQILALVHQAVLKGRPHDPDRVTFQTRTLRYASMYWVEALGLEAHWKDARIDAQADAANLTVTTANIASLKLSWPKLRVGSTVTIDQQAVKLSAPIAATPAATLVKAEGRWRQATEAEAAPGLRKVHGLQGPIDDAFMASFVVVKPSARSANPVFQRWVDAELAHFLDRWAALMRGDARVKSDGEITDEDIKNSNLILWGDPASNKLIARIAERLPMHWRGAELVIGERSFPAATHASVLIFPNPLNPARYVVLNSGLTFREASDRTNSLQNPKLPDWAVIDLSQRPDENAPGRIADAGFFDEQWKVKP